VDAVAQSSGGAPGAPPIDYVVVCASCNRTRADPIFRAIFLFVLLVSTTVRRTLNQIRSVNAEVHSLADQPLVSRSDQAAAAAAGRPVATRYTIVSAPTENIGHKLQTARALALNDALAAAFAAGAFPPNWDTFDWAALTRVARPPNVVPTGMHKNAWHYACHFYAQATHYTRQNRTPFVVAQRSGECGEHANTMLWDKLLRPGGRPRRWTGRSDSAGGRADRLS